MNDDYAENETAARREARRLSFIKIAELIYGPRFGVQLSEALGVSQGLISHIVTDRRAVTDDIEDKLHAHAEKAGRDLISRSMHIGTAIGLAKKARRLGHEVTTSTGAVPDAQVAEPDLDEDGPSHSP